MTCPHRHDHTNVTCPHKHGMTTVVRCVTATCPPAHLCKLVNQKVVRGVLLSVPFEVVPVEAMQEAAKNCSVGSDSRLHTSRLGKGASTHAIVGRAIVGHAIVGYVCACVNVQFGVCASGYSISHRWHARGALSGKILGGTYGTNTCVYWGTHVPEHAWAHRSLCCFLATCQHPCTGSPVQHARKPLGVSYLRRCPLQHACALCRQSLVSFWPRKGRMTPCRQKRAARLRRARSMGMPRSHARLQLKPVTPMVCAEREGCGPYRYTWSMPAPQKASGVRAPELVLAPAYKKLRRPLAVDSAASTTSGIGRTDLSHRVMSSKAKAS